MDTDISHAAELRFQAIEARLDELDGGKPPKTEDDENGEGEGEEEGESEGEESVPETTSSSRRGGRRSTTSESTEFATAGTEGYSI